jgi:hypothetical protein
MSANDYRMLMLNLLFKEKDNIKEYDSLSEEEKRGYENGLDFAITKLAILTPSSN